MTLWLLENLDEKTMDWIQHEFAAVPLTFFNQIKTCVNRGVLVPADSQNANTYLDSRPKTDLLALLLEDF